MSFREMLRAFGRPGKGRRGTKRTGKAGPGLAVERLEDRLVPTTTLFLDFGETFPASGLQLTVKQLRETLNGPDLRSESRADTDTLTFKPLSSIVNDANALEGKVLELVQRYYAPFDVRVQRAGARNLTDVTNDLAQNGTDPTGHN